MPNCGREWGWAAGRQGEPGARLGASWLDVMLRAALVPCSEALSPCTMFHSQPCGVCTPMGPALGPAHTVKQTPPPGALQSNPIHAAAAAHLVGVYADGGHPRHAKVKGRDGVSQLPRKRQHKAAQAAVDMQRHAATPRHLQGREAMRVLRSGGGRQTGKATAGPVRTGASAGSCTAAAGQARASKRHSPPLQCLPHGPPVGAVHPLNAAQRYYLTARVLPTLAMSATWSTSP